MAKKNRVAPIVQKPAPNPHMSNYTTFDLDMANLFHMIDREVFMSTKLIFEPLEEQLIDDMLLDEDIQPLINEVIVDIMDSLAPSYIKYIETKYIGEGKLLTYVTKEVFYKLNMFAVKSNKKKMTAAITRSNVQRLTDLNKQ